MHHNAKYNTIERNIIARNSSISPTGLAEIYSMVKTFNKNYNAKTDKIYIK